MFLEGVQIPDAALPLLVGRISIDASSRSLVNGARAGDNYFALGPLGSAGNHPPKTGAVEISSLGCEIASDRDPTIRWGQVIDETTK